ncbi:MAG: endonuclease domain-containing protein [Clostridia bacterium]|nr:endonuclease domain-containing protein [Clostridia bacterium]
MNSIQNPKLTLNARKLRKEMTEEERKLWYTFLKKLPFTVHRQKVIQRYIVDFYIAEAKIVIELDGSQHYEEKGEQADKERDLALKELGFTVLRYTNLDIQRKFKMVCEIFGIGWKPQLPPHPSLRDTFSSRRRQGGIFSEGKGHVCVE